MKTKKHFHKLTAWLLTLAMLMTFIPSFTLSAFAAEEELMCHDSITRNDLNRLSFITSEDEELWLLPSDKMIGTDTEILDESFGYALNVTFVNDSIKDWGYYNQATGILRAMAYDGWIPTSMKTQA